MNSYVNQQRRLAAKRPGFPEGAVPAGARAVVLEAALRLFAERGFAGASIRDIGAEAGIKSASLYAHYTSKEHILADLIYIAHKELHQRLKDAVLDAGADPREQVMALVRAHVRAHTDWSMLAVVANSEMHMLSDELRAPALFLRHESEALLLDVIRRGMTMKVFSVADAMLAVAAISAAGIRVAHWYSDDSGINPDHVADTYAQFALRILGAGGTGASPTPFATVSPLREDRS